MAKINLFTPTGQKKTQLTAPDKIFKAKLNPVLMAQAVRVYLSNQRVAQAQTKTRGQIDVTHAKVWRQKGTGRARHGSRNAPIFVGGAKAHGPSGEQNYSLNLSKKMKQLSLFSALSQQFKNDCIFALEGLDKLELKTKKFDKVFNKLTPSPQKLLLLLDKPSVSLQRATKNLPFLTTSLSQNLNTYQVLKAKKLIFTPEALKALEAHYLKK